VTYTTAPKVDIPHSAGVNAFSALVESNLARVPVLGELLVRSGWVSRSKLNEALARQASRNLRLGEILVEMGVLDHDDLKAVLDFQQDIRLNRHAKFAALLGSRLGTLLLRSASITQEQLDRAMREHETTGGLLGEILVRQGALAPETLQGALSFQRRLAAEGPTQFSLGQMLVQSGAISEASLAKAIAHQRATGRRLGEVLLEREILSEDVLQRVLTRQRKLIALAATSLAITGGMLPTQSAAGDTMQLNIRASVLEHTSISRLSVPSSLAVSADDVARGYVEVDEPVTIDVRTNSAAGAVLGFSLQSPMVSSVTLNGTSNGVVVSETGANMHLAKQGKGLETQSVSLRVRVVLAPQAQPGTLAWPIAVFLAPA
jgi:hypothetical protein